MLLTIMKFSPQLTQFIGVVNKAIIICKGWSEFEIEGDSFTSIDMAIEKLGTRILDDFPNWVWKSEKEWVVLKGNGDWATSFTLLNECPFRTKVRC